MTALQKRRNKVRMPDEYVCNMCGFLFLSGEKVNIFCPECGSSMVAKEVSYEEFLDEDAYSFNFKQINFQKLL
ncbi:MAG: hypothetical protein BWX58_01559 [Deltaproteobacteria bacterium ADurb.Bin026]|jgi:DNA-directed RNA polymerase subunit RPC12/RpoP|nr:hypothetical protein [Syntrophorhabdaceae bacterium]OQC47412.1 MAG: hypothetical protein BWX58_01559 [Deltaproteobacteria bacterium ADurb.Bin026]